jgi:hypothetical protein
MRAESNAEAIQGPWSNADLGGLESGGYIRPIQDFPETIDIISSAILILQVISMFPHI